MRRILTTLALPPLVGALALQLLAQRPAAPSPEPLPRQVGPVYLLMPAQLFTRLTHRAPDCALTDACGPHETRSVAFIDTLPPQSGGLPQPQQFDCLFLRDTLYSMLVLPEDRRFEVIRSRFTALYGAPAREDTTDDGSGALIWQSKTTRLTVVYVRNAAPNSPRPGTVTGVQMADVKRAALAEKERGDRPWP
jgi:hypothetical protein